ncbi:peptide-methionine (S)-S-oxide reductase MsrA [Candidatus Woesearchaeota archaeon]|nr:peptide-methionine (S)-S-oxide reductase MsrA [Candidatus Woesearchaeota archaeon]
MKKATFAAGCFWGIEKAYRAVKGVTKVTSGYMGGDLDSPSYEDIPGSGHAEVVQVEFDSKKVSYEELLDVFWQIHDPTQLNKQGPDVGEQYRSAIFYHSDEQKKIALNSKKKAQKNYPKKIVTVIEKAGKFYKAEEYHQNYLEKNPARHCSIMVDQFLAKKGGKK